MKNLALPLFVVAVCFLIGSAVLADAIASGQPGKITCTAIAMTIILGFVALLGHQLLKLRKKKLHA
ncbi:hypothetical protein FNT36_11740 [Hymenobacter setariae]|uniref:Uncharacterized protein n=1 Tax=Hymenobacter setariae TaxID=2594794 RepID=A0A558BUG6_9BACT|nr:hypothetical protein FNT36_11740 [Hymenobacter setariae]